MQHRPPIYEGTIVGEVTLTDLHEESCVKCL